MMAMITHQKQKVGQKCPNVLHMCWEAYLLCVLFPISILEFNQINLGGRWAATVRKLWCRGYWVRYDRYMSYTGYLEEYWILHLTPIALLYIYIERDLIILKYSPLLQENYFLPFQGKNRMFACFHCCMLLTCIPFPTNKTNCRRTLTQNWKDRRDHDSPGRTVEIKYKSYVLSVIRLLNPLPKPNHSVGIPNCKKDQTVPRQTDIAGNPRSCS